MAYFLTAEILQFVRTLSNVMMQMVFEASTELPPQFNEMQKFKQLTSLSRLLCYLYNDIWM